MTNLDYVVNERIMLDDAQIPSHLVTDDRSYRSAQNSSTIENLKVRVPEPAAVRQHDSYVPNKYLG